uniref:uncharacterized protein LOC105349700 n=1 Tax=Fragaria vesca subsp. vesca TaxID=101020 RepID=UPI0005C8A481|nr:PREDICTED: uncharacterized protein LOC105349700 [Fragaria vesca subsp. vesca]
MAFLPLMVHDASHVLFQPTLVQNNWNTIRSTNAALVHNDIDVSVIPPLEPEEDRTIVVTFSPVDPIPECELRDFFIWCIYCTTGDQITVTDHHHVIAGIRMEPGERPCCAYIVFRYASFVERLLGGNQMIIFHINRYIVSARKYEQSLEEFNKFHNIDRRLYTRLIYDLRRDVDESAAVMALWMSIEHISKEFNNLVNKALTLPDTELNAIADETVIALNYITTDDIESDIEIPKLQAVSDSPVTLKFFHDNHHAIICGTIKFLKDVCLKTFQDFPHQPNYHAKDKLVEENRSIFHQEREIEDKEAAETSRNSPSGDEQERTLFLTFSRGFPLSENEVRECFTREFGDIVDRIYMQEVKEKLQQPIYAQLVVRSASLIPMILDGRSKVDLSINGKHIRAKKSVPKLRSDSSEASSQRS